MLPSLDPLYTIKSNYFIVCMCADEQFIMQLLYSYLTVRVSENADKGFKMYDLSDSMYIDVAVHCRRALGEGYDNNLIAITVF